MGRIVFACLVAMLAVPLWAGPDEEQALFDNLFSERIEKVRATFSKTDDTALAAQLVSAAAEATGQKHLLFLFCDAAYELGRVHPSGYESAAKAMQILAKHHEEKKIDALLNIVQIRKMQYASVRTRSEKKSAGDLLVDQYVELAGLQEKAGDPDAALASCKSAFAVARSTGSDRAEQIKALYDRLLVKKATYRRIKGLKLKLKTRPEDHVAAEALVKTIVVELNDPAEARKYTFAVKDEALKKNVSNAAKDIEQITPEASLELGYWYSKLAATAPDAFETDMYRQAETYLENGLVDPEVEGLSKIKARLSLKNIKKKLAKQQEAGAGRWINLLKTADPAKYRLAGRGSDFNVQAKGLLISNGYGGGTPCLAIPAVPRGDYELQLAVAFPKKGTAKVLLPVGESSVALEIRETGHIALATVSGEKWPEKPVKIPSSSPGPVQVTVKVHLKGKGAVLKLSPTGSTKSLNWAGSVSALSPAGWEKAKLKSIGLSVVGYPKVLFGVLKIRSLSGKITPLSSSQMQAAAARMKAK